MARFAIEHIREDNDINVFLHNVYKSLRPNGIFAIIEYYIHDLDITDNTWKTFRIKEIETYQSSQVHSRISLKLPEKLKAANFRNIKSTINHISPSTIGEERFYDLIKEYTKLYAQISPELWPQKMIDELLSWCDKHESSEEPIIFTSHTLAQK